MLHKLHQHHIRFQVAEVEVPVSAVASVLNEEERPIDKPETPKASAADFHSKPTASPPDRNQFHLEHR